MCDPRDLQVAVQVRSPLSGEPTCILWEPTPGGVGLAERCFDDFPALINAARVWLRDCPCAEGCPRCVGPPVAGLVVQPLVAAVLRGMEATDAVAAS